MMKYYTARALRRSARTLWRDIEAGEDVIITRKGEPAAMMIRVSQEDLEDVIRAVGQARGMIAFEKMREIAACHGHLSEEEIEAEVEMARTEARKGQT